MSRPPAQRELPAVASQKRSWEACEQALERLYLGPCRAWSNARQDYSGAPIKEATVKSILQTINRKIGNNAEMWWSAAALAVELGYCDETLLRAYDALECRGLIHIEEHWSGRIRQLRIRIDWSVVFGGVARPSHRRQAREASATRRHVPTISRPRLHNPRPTSPLLVAHVSTISGIPHTPYKEESEIEPPIHPDSATAVDAVGGWVGGESSIGNCQLPIANSSTRASVPPCLRGESSGSQPSTLNPQRSSAPMPTRTITAAEDSLTRRLVALGVGSARATVQEALRIGFTPEAVAAILEWFEGQGRTDLEGHVWYPYSPQQLVWRLRDEDGRDARPEHGNWKGGKCAIWGSLDPDPPARTPAGKDDIRASPTPHSRFFDGLDREKCRTLVQRLAQSPDPLGLRCRKLVDLFDAAWPIGYLTVPPAIRKLLALFPLERLKS